MAGKPEVGCASCQLAHSRLPAREMVQKGFVSRVLQSPVMLSYRLSARETAMQIAVSRIAAVLAFALLFSSAAACAQTVAGGDCGLPTPSFATSAPNIF